MSGQMEYGMASLLWFVFACFALVIGGGTSVLAFVFLVAWLEKKVRERNIDL